MIASHLGAVCDAIPCLTLLRFVLFSSFSRAARFHSFSIPSPGQIPFRWRTRLTSFGRGDRKRAENEQNKNGMQIRSTIVCNFAADGQPSSRNVIRKWLECSGNQHETKKGFEWTETKLQLSFGIISFATNMASVGRNSHTNVATKLGLTTICVLFLVFVSGLGCAAAEDPPNSDAGPEPFGEHIFIILSALICLRLRADYNV